MVQRSSLVLYIPNLKTAVCSMNPRLPKLQPKSRNGGENLPETKTQRVQSTNTVECRVAILGIAIMILGSSPHNST